MTNEEYQNSIKKVDRLTVKWKSNLYDTFDPIDIADNDYSKINYEKILSRLGKFEDVEEYELEQKNKTIKIANKNGYEVASRQLIEEMAELIQAINKFWRKDLKCGCSIKYLWDRSLPTDSETRNGIITEIADVEIMLSQIKYLMSCHDEVEKEKARKIERQLQRMESEQI